MTRRSDWEEERFLALRHEIWTLTGEKSLVKVEPLPFGPPYSLKSKPLGGYFTTREALHSKTPEQIQAVLGLPLGSLAYGARIYRFLRRPTQSEYDYQLTTKFPGGLAFTFMSDPNYPPGQGVVHQWELKKNVLIPGEFLLDLRPGEVFPRDLWLKKRI